MATFLFGLATSAFQSEGGLNGPGQPTNNWAGWEASGRAAASGRALDLWANPAPYLDAARDVGANALRLSVEWARCEPTPGTLDEAAFERYRALLDGCRERGLEPVVALHHFTHPRWLGPDFWLRLGSPERFAAWAGAVASRLGDHCRYWMTINELNVLPFATYVTGRFPPGRRLRTGDAVRSLGHLLAAHVLAYRALHRRLGGRAVISTNNHALSVYELDRLLIDVLVARGRGVARSDLHAWLVERRGAYHEAVGHLAAGTRPSALETAVRRAVASAVPLDAALPGAVSAVYEDDDHPRPLDLVQVNYYDPAITGRLRLPGRRSAGGRDWSPTRQPWEDAVHPGGLPAYLALNHEPGLDLWVAENGLCNRVAGGRAFPRLDGWDRSRYLEANLAAVERARAGGLPVTGYFHWTLADNYEWGSYEHRFGLYRADQDGADQDGADQDGRGGPARWSALDAFGTDAAANFRRLARRFNGGPGGGGA